MIIYSPNSLRPGAFYDQFAIMAYLRSVCDYGLTGLLSADGTYHYHSGKGRPRVSGEMAMRMSPTTYTPATTAQACE